MLQRNWRKRSWLRMVFVIALLPWAVTSDGFGADNKRPNVVVILTDDQGHGDLGFHDNPIIRTPHLDRLARESSRFTRFYVSPVCSPTRSSLLTGRYHYRTGVVDTYLGRSLMDSDETTLAEMLAGAGYRTGIFGKWHLGDNYPMRPMDQGFQESLVHKGGGIGQPSDPPGGTSYFDPVLLHNGKPIKTRGYCSDVYTDAALAFMEANPSNPFLIWLAFNAPHTPLEVPESYERHYRESNLARTTFPDVGRRIAETYSAEVTARIYGMVENIDDNVGRVLGQLDRLNLASQTVVVFLSDNGPQQPRYNSGLRGLKGTVYEGGIRTPFFIRWPGHIPAALAIDTIAAHVDLTPTILGICVVEPPLNVRMDGVNLEPLLAGRAQDWPDRNLFLQWHRGSVPQAGRGYAVVGQRFKLVQAEGVAEGPLNNGPVPELFDLSVDPYEQVNCRTSFPHVAEQMLHAYDRWFADVTEGRDYLSPPRIHLGSREESISILTRQDWRGPKAGWAPTSLGHWDVEVVTPGDYIVTVHFPAQSTHAQVQLRFGRQVVRQSAAAGVSYCIFYKLPWLRGPTQLEAQIALDQSRHVFGPDYLTVTRVE